MKTSALLKTLLVLSLLGSPAQPSAAESEAGFKSLFNGRTLNGWKGDPKFWSVKEGKIVGQTTAENPTKENTFLIYTNENVNDFELRLSYKITGGNSGIQYRSEEVAPFVVAGYQADIDSTPRYSGILYEERGRAILAERGQMIHIQPNGQKRVVGTLGSAEEIQKVIKPNDWNDYVIIASGNRLVHSINGRITAICVDEHKGHAPTEGILALQLHAGPPMTIEFRNIRIRPLKE